MLIAETFDGEVKSLYSRIHNSSYVQSLRHLPLRCPACKSPVLVKSGPKVIPHFAHKSKVHCSGFSESESSLHLLAKTRLNDWLSSQSCTTELEKTYTRINRRTDISVRFNSVEYAFEFQCSPVSSETVQQRSMDYRKIGVIPFWLVPTVIAEHSKLIKLTSFQQQFIRYSQVKNQYYLITYSPEKRLFTILHHLIPLSRSLFYTDQTSFPQHILSFPHFPLETFEAAHRHYHLHLKMNEKWMLNVFKYRKSFKDPLLKRIYTAKSSLFSLPPWVGLFLKSNIFYSVPPMEWQAYLYLYMKQTGTFTSLQLVAELKSLIRHQCIHLRILHENFPSDFVRSSVEELLHLLTICSIINTNGEFYKLAEPESEISVQNRDEKLKHFHRLYKEIIIQEYNRR
ncbi:competence protein CoiA [Jeotgalibacillus terrae]|uniref:Competence protein CoiA n=1 Tax=Jeotgalibacillus terrae TaxID=587735 RepID=A0ABW5ZGJ8_9BACL|nr:competence protein CoiA family protein [Jeotgalibacillus terrae]MBM7579750.1 competence protein CoiA [Jeotgalibacillus terrae]